MHFEKRNPWVRAALMKGRERAYQIFSSASSQFTGDAVQVACTLLEISQNPA